MKKLIQDKSLFFLKFFRGLMFVGFVGLILGVITFLSFFVYFNKNLPRPGQVVRRVGYSTKIYDRNENLLYELHKDERRERVELDQVSDYLKNATIAIEDKDFYNHQGFDFLTIFRIPYYYLTQNRLVGGSTLTQQLVKNVLLTSERKVSRKFKELILSLQIEQKYNKDQILQMYLNEAPYGGNVWGVETASKFYFNKKAKNLSLTESAILAGLPQRPSFYFPFANKTDENGVPYWRGRTVAVLTRMKEDGYINADEYQQSVEKLGDVEFHQQITDIKAPHFVFYIKDVLEEMYGDELALSGGLKVTTSLDLDIQKQTQQIVYEEIEKVKKGNVTNGAALVMNPTNGEILAMVGSKNYFSDEIDGQFNVATQALRQPGSTIKPITYLGLIQRGYTPASVLVDVRTHFRVADNQKDYYPMNYNGAYYGPVSLRKALANSLNVPAVKGVAILGVENFLQLAHSMGFESLAPTSDNLTRFGLAVTLGGGEVTMLDLSSSFSVFANKGEKVEPVSILKIEDQSGKVVYQNKKAISNQVIDEAEAFLITDMLMDNNARSLVFGTNSLLNTKKPIAVKTGTTNDLKDNWAVGWSNSFLVTTWVGNNDNTPMKGIASGLTGATPIWRKTVDLLLENGYEANDWEIPDNVEEVLVDAKSGYLAHDDFPAKKEFVIKGSIPNIPDPIHQKIKVCRGENKFAPESKIARGDYDEKEVMILREDDYYSQDGVNRWQEAIDAWIEKQDNDIYKIPTEFCSDDGGSDQYVRLFEPKNEKEYDGEDIKIHAEVRSEHKVERIMIFVNNQQKADKEDSSIDQSINLPRGKYEVFVKAKLENGDEIESQKVNIATGGDAL